MGGLREYEECELPDSYASPEKGRDYEPSRKVPRPHGSVCGGQPQRPQAAPGLQSSSSPSPSSLNSNRRSALEEARAQRSPRPGSTLQSRIATQKETLDDYKKQIRRREAQDTAPIHQQSRQPQQAPSPRESTPLAASSSSGYAVSRADDIAKQLRLVQKQLQSREKKLTTLENTLELEESRAERLQEEVFKVQGELAGGGVEVEEEGVETYEQLDAALQAERRLVREAEMKLGAVKAALGMTQERCTLELRTLGERWRREAKEAHEVNEAKVAESAVPSVPSQQVVFGGLYRPEGMERPPVAIPSDISQMDAIRMQMRSRLQKVKDDMAAQFSEERAKLENRAEYLARMVWWG